MQSNRITRLSKAPETFVSPVRPWLTAIFPLLLFCAVLPVKSAEANWQNYSPDSGEFEARMPKTVKEIASGEVVEWVAEITAMDAGTGGKTKGTDEFQIVSKPFRDGQQARFIKTMNKKLAADYILESVDVKGDGWTGKQLRCTKRTTNTLNSIIVYALANSRKTVYVLTATGNEVDDLQFIKSFKIDPDKTPKAHPIPRSNSELVARTANIAIGIAGLLLVGPVMIKSARRRIPVAAGPEERV